MSARKPPDEKIGSIPPFGLRMLPPLRQSLEEAARQNGRSLNAEIIARLEFTLAETEQDLKEVMAAQLYPMVVEIVRAYQRGEKPDVKFKRKPKLVKPDSTPSGS